MYTVFRIFKEFRPVTRESRQLARQTGLVWHNGLNLRASLDTTWLSRQDATNGFDYNTDQVNLNRLPVTGALDDLKMKRGR